MTLRCSLFVAACTVVLAAPLLLAQEKRAVEDNLAHYVWDLSESYKDEAAWERDRQAIEAGIKDISHWKGRLGRNAKELADGLDGVADLRRRASKIALYGEMQVAVDRNSSVAQQHSDVGVALEAKVNSAVAFVPDEIKRIGRSRLLRWIAQHPRLAKHRIRLLRVLHQAPYTLPAREQALIESMSRWPWVSGDAFWALHDSDVGWPNIRSSDGRETTINLYNYKFVPESQRVEAFTVLLKRLKGLENAFGLLYTRRVEAALTIAKHRGFSGGIEAEWYLRDSMPIGSHRHMVAVARANLPTLQRYVRLRSQAVGMDPSYSALAAAAPSAAQSFSIAESKRIAFASSKTLGAEYQQQLIHLFAHSWMHLPPSPEKQGIYSINPPAGLPHPLFIMSYRNDYRSSRAFVGGLTLMVSYSNVPKDRISDTRDDPAIYSNAIIYVGNMLHDEYLTAHARNREDKIAYLVQSLDLLWSQYYRWVIIADLDARVEQLIADGKPPTGQQVSQLYLQLLREYYGTSVDEVFGTEWGVYPVPFLSYEHQFWPPAAAAAALIVERLHQGDARAQKAVYQVLERGNSNRSYELMKDAGIDLDTKQPYEAVPHRMNVLLDELENEFKKKE